MVNFRGHLTPQTGDVLEPSRAQTERVKLVVLVVVVWFASSFVLGGLWGAVNWRRNRHLFVEHGGHHQHDTKLAGEYTAAA